MKYDEVIEQTKTLTNNEDYTNVNIDVNNFDMSSYEYTTEDDITDKEIKYVEGVIRRSNEYKRYINYLRTELDISSDAILKNIDVKDTPVGFEMHHHPFNLYTIVYSIMKFMISTEQHVTIYDICEKVMYEHYAGNIGMVGLTSTGHELAHSRSILIPWSEVYGNPSIFVDKYKDCISPEALAYYEEAITITDVQANIKNSETYDKNILKYNIAYNHDTVEVIKEDDSK